MRKHTLFFQIPQFCCRQIECFAWMKRLNGFNAEILVYIFQFIWISCFGLFCENSSGWTRPAELIDDCVHWFRPHLLYQCKAVPDNVRVHSLVCIASTSFPIYCSVCRTLFPCAILERPNRSLKFNRKKKSYWRLKSCEKSTNPKKKMENYAYHCVVANDCDFWTVWILDLTPLILVPAPISFYIWMFDSRHNDSTNCPVAFVQTQMHSRWSMLTSLVGARWMCRPRFEFSPRTDLKIVRIGCFCFSDFFFFFGFFQRIEVFVKEKQWFSIEIYGRLK